MSGHTEFHVQKHSQVQKRNGQIEHVVTAVVTAPIIYASGGPHIQYSYTGTGSDVDTAWRKIERQVNAACSQIRFMTQAGAWHRQYRERMKNSGTPYRVNSYKHSCGNPQSSQAAYAVMKNMGKSKKSKNIR